MEKQALLGDGANKSFPLGLKPSLSGVLQQLLVRVVLLIPENTVRLSGKGNIPGMAPKTVWASTIAKSGSFLAILGS